MAEMKLVLRLLESVVDVGNVGIARVLFKSLSVGV